MVRFKHQPGCMCCGCLLFYYHEAGYHANTENELDGHPDIEVISRTWLHAQSYRKVSPLGASESVAVAAKVKLYIGDIDVEGEKNPFEYRLIFEADEEMQNYRFAHLREVEYEHRTDRLFRSWMLELGVRENGVDAVQAYDYVTQPGESDYELVGWLTLARDADGWEGYSAQFARSIGVAGSDMECPRSANDGTTYGIASHPVLTSRHPPDFDTDTEPGLWCYATAGLEQPLSDPPGTYCAIETRYVPDAYSYGAVPSDYIDGVLAHEVTRFCGFKHKHQQLASDLDDREIPQDDICCWNNARGSHSPCKESIITITPSVNGYTVQNASPGGSTPEYLGWPIKLLGTQFNEVPLRPQDAGRTRVIGPPDGFGVYYWNCHIWLALVNADDPDRIAEGQSPCALRVWSKVEERSSRRPNTYAIDFVWETVIPLADHAAACDGMSFEFDNYHEFPELDQFQSITWDLSI